jgi:tRNA U34 5-carboxymethylaminomethyl modifying GTPase MnmE/TrmE
MQKSLVQHLEALEGVLSRLPQSFSLEESRRIASLLKDIDTTPLRLAVIGPFSSGKTSVINMLIGRPVLPIAMQETTATSFLVSTVPLDAKEHLELRDGSELPLDKVAEVNMTELQDVKVFVHSENIPSGFEILDTPGLSSAFEVHEKITAEALARADVLLLVVDAKQGVPRAMLDFMRANPTFAAKSYLLLNKADLLPKEDREKVLKFNLTVVQPLNVAGVLLTSTTSEPGIEELRNLITKDLPPKAKALKTKVGARRLWALCTNLKNILKELLEATTLDTSGIDAKIEEHAQRREQILSQIRKKTQDLFAEVKAECRNTVASFERRSMALVQTWTRRILDGASETGFGDDLRAIWEEEAERLQGRLQKIIGSYRADLDSIGTEVAFQLPWWTNWIDWVFALLATLGPMTGGWGNLIEAVIGKLLGKEIREKLVGRMVQNALQTVVSQWVREANKIVEARLHDLREDVERYVRETLEPQMKEVEGALEALKKEKTQKVLDVEERRKGLQNDIGVIDSIMSDIRTEARP